MSVVVSGGGGAVTMAHVETVMTPSRGLSSCQGVLWWQLCLSFLFWGSGGQMLDIGGCESREALCLLSRFIE